MSNTFHKRNLPHLYFDEGRYFITYRLANSIPLDKLSELAKINTNLDFKSYHRLFQKYDLLLDSCDMGINYLNRTELAEICKQSLDFPDKKEYTLICYCIMPNHVHLVFELLPGNKGISEIMKLMKGYSAVKCNSIIGKEGKFWQVESYDRWIRDDKELYFTINYVLLNPVKAGLVDNWENWKYSYCRKEYLTF
jgi:putative transposase